MSSTTLPPAPPLPPELRPPDPDALIKEARRRTQGRRALYGLAALFAAGAAVAGFTAFRGGDGAALGPPPGSTHAAPSAGAVPPAYGPAPEAGSVANGPLALVNGTFPDRIILIGARGRFDGTLPICRTQCGAIQSAAWSPNGQALAYGTTTGPGGAEAPRDGLHLFDLATKHDRLLSHVWVNWQDLAWSPDAKRLAYVTDASLFVLPIAHPNRITPIRTNATSPTWSPDGRHIAYDRCAAGRSSGIDVALADGSHVRHLTRVGCSPAWSPDGSRIAYTVWCGIKVVTPAGKQLTTASVWACRHIGVAGPPAWSPDARRIAIGGNGVYVMNRDGSRLTKIWDRPALRPSWRAIVRP